VRAVLRAVDPGLPIVRLNTVDQHLDDVLAQDRLVAVLSSAFGVVAVFMACLGLFGVASHGVMRRTSEIGVRLALGATRSAIFRMVMTESGRLVGAGLGAGLLAAVLLTRQIESRLHGVSAADPLTIAGAAVLLAIVATLSAWIPAHRAAAVDPLTAIRTE
jgi:ABC-type antimicrobial peptide transport system permease subunit